jgi:hypothetical protein
MKRLVLGGHCLESLVYLKDREWAEAGTVRKRGTKGCQRMSWRSGVAREDPAAKQQRSTKMIKLTTSLAIGACLVLSSAGAAFAGQPGQSCGGPGPIPAPGNSAGTPSPIGPHGQAGGSPFAADTKGGIVIKGYAGNTTNPGNITNTTAVSQYDVACFNQLK